jgi:two-component system, LytTR family, sensor kinase
LITRGFLPGKSSNPAASMIPFIYRKWYYRLVTGSFLGLLTWLLDEVMLSIRYRYFVMFLQPLNFFYAAIFGILIHETVYFSGKILDKRQAWDNGPGKRLLMQMVGSLLIAFFWIVAIRLFINYLIFHGKLIIFSDEFMLVALAVTLLFIINLAEFGFYLNDRYRRSLAEVERFRKENAEYQFEMLKLQLNPHFLFNSLNTLSSLVNSDAVKATEFIRRLSDVYRYVLENRNKELVSLREEMEFIHSFSFLQGLRFQGMIDFRFEIGEELLDRKIAPMTLQLLVENAVKHNVVSSKQPLNILISAENDNLIITNNLQIKEELSGTGVGLKNIISRYAFLTERKVEIIREDKLFKVVIPLI